MTLRAVRLAGLSLGVLGLLAGVLAFRDRSVVVEEREPPSGIAEERPADGAPDRDSLLVVVRGRRLLAAPDPVGDGPSPLPFPPPRALSLVGIFAGSRPSALVSGVPGADGPTIVSPGDSVGEAVVQKIGTKHVVLSLGDSTLTLTIANGPGR